MARMITLTRAQRLAWQHGTTVDRLSADYPPLRNALTEVTYPDDRVPLAAIVTALGY